MSERRPLNPAERFTLACSCLVLAVLIGLIAIQLTASHEPAAPVATIERVERVGELHHVEVSVSNDGDDTAANVQVAAELTVDGETSEGDQTIDFLAGGSTEDLVFVFEDDPADGEVTVAVSGFSVP
ncbi:MAG: TIGR02588 family protein [Actinomycetota bacterium]|jgi:uncharacterized protein (TIGR02588 family)|nr:TIGR02588 family protein [Actinomycetota bacterium]